MDETGGCNVRRYLSKEKIDTFCGNVFPLQLLAEEDLSKAPIVWSIEGEAVTIRNFAASEEFPFTNGILVTAIKPGEAVICAKLEGQRYCCQTIVREQQTAADDEPLQYYIGDLHIHSSMEHDHEKFAVRTEEFPEELLEQIAREGILDFCVVSDHGDTLNDKDFFRGFVADEKVSHEKLVVFPGAESEVTSIERDRYGYSHKNSGEIVTLNANNYAGVKTWEEFLDRFSDSPFGFAILAHPHVVGYDQNGIWNFYLQKNQQPELKKLVKLVELGNGEPRESNIIYEHYYSVALDCGYHVAPCCDSDSHAAYKYCPGKTVIMAPEKSKEAFLDAVRKHRVYACESGLVELDYRVNGYGAGATLPLTERYQFKVSVALRQEEASAMPVKCEVITDYGWKIKTVDMTGVNTVTFEVISDTARYFYLRLVDAEGRKTWSAPVWTSRVFDDMSRLFTMKALDKTSFTAYDEVARADAGVLINDDPRAIYRSACQTASIVIDMKEEQVVCGLGHITPVLLRDEVKQQGISILDTVAEFAGDCRILVSMDGENFREVVSGSVRVFGGEDLFTFPSVRARYVKFEVLSTVGKNTDRPQFADAPLRMAELTVFTDGSL